MRDIKFRAWDKISLVMTTVDMLRLIGNQTYQQYGLLFKGQDYLRMPEEIELMQYTGLKDKNGKEIYEGDVIRVNVENKYIEFHNGSWVHVNPKDVVDSSFLNFFDWHNYEVIGNIYENPVLLKP